MKTWLLLVSLSLLCSAVRGSESLLFQDPLDGKALGRAAGITWAQGKDGQAAVLDSAGDTIEYPPERFGRGAGRIEFDISLTKPLSADHPFWCLFSDIGAGSSHFGAINVHWREKSGVLEFGIFDGGTHHWCLSTTTDWQVGRWYHLRLVYGPGGMRLEVDGKVEGTNPYPNGLSETAKRIGFHDGYVSAPPVMVDDFRTYRTTVDALDITPSLISPNGDGLLDTARITYDLSRDSIVTFDLLREGRWVKRLIDHASVPMGQYGMTWDGNGVPDGAYTLSMIASSADGSREMDRTVRIDRRWKWKKPGPAFAHFFPTGVWYFWESDASYINQHADDQEKVRQYYEGTMNDLADHGVNLIVANWTPHDHRQMLLDAARKHGVKVIVHLDEINRVIAGGTDADQQRLFDIASEAVEPLRNDPTVVGYYMVDEPNNSPEVARRIALARQVLEAVDPTRPGFSCLLGGYEDLLRTVDYRVLLIDIYPLGAGWNGDFSGYIGELQRGQRNAGERPLWVILQAFGKPNAWKVPTPEEVRAEVWLALAHGAKGIAYFIYQSTTGIQGEWLQGLVGMDLKPMDARLDEVGRINVVIRKLAPTLLDLKPADFSLPPVPDSVLAKPFTDSKGRRYAILVNKDVKNPVDVRWDGPVTDLLSGGAASEITLPPGGGVVLRLR